VETHKRKLAALRIRREAAKGFPDIVQRLWSINDAGSSSSFEGWWRQKSLLHRINVRRAHSNRKVGSTNRGRRQGGHIAVPLVQFAKTLEFDVVVVDDREEFANKNRFPLANEVKLGDFGSVVKSIDFREGDSVVIITRGHQHDEVVLKECLSKDGLPGYVGMIGSKEKIAATFSHLRQQGISEQLLAIVRAPIGLDIGARSPAEIALSIMAEIVAQRYGKIAKQSETTFRKKEVVSSS